MSRSTPSRAVFFLAAAVLLALPGCAATPVTDATPADRGRVTVEDAWVKAADAGMSAAFGDLVNTGDTAVTVVSADTTAADAVELHETVEDAGGQMTMREVDGGFVVPADGTLALEPGGAHLMLMGLKRPLAAGDEITIDLVLSDGRTVSVTAPVKDYAGANESYDDGGEHG